jgi:hypothetical protein
MRSLKNAILYAPLVVVLASIAPKPALAAGSTYLPSIGCTGYPYGHTTSNPITCSPTIPSGDLGPGAAATNLGVNQVSPTEPRYGGVCDGSTVDTAAFDAAITASTLIVLPAGKTCLVGNLVLTSRQVLDCNNSLLNAAPGALWIVKKTGFASQIRNCLFSDPTLITMQTTTLSSGVASGVNILPVVSAATFQANMIATVQLASGAYWTSKVTSVNVGGNTITLADPIPWTVTAIAVGSGGTGWGSDEAVLLGVDGAPTTLGLTTTAGAITGVTIDAPGLYQLNPGSPLAPFDPKAPAAFGASLNVTYGGALAGAFVDAAFGVVTDDQANGGTIENVTIGEAPVGLEVLASIGTTTEENIRSFNVNAAILTAFAKLSGVNNTVFDKLIGTGFTHHASAYGATGLYIEGDSRTYANGGNTYDFWTLGFETGMLDMNGQLDHILHGIVDTNRNYGMVCIGCQYTDFVHLFASFTGPNAIPSLGSTAGKGIGAYFGSGAVNPAINDSVTKLTSSNNVSDLHFGDGAGSVKIGEPWGPSKIMTTPNTGSISLYSSTAIVAFSTLQVGGLTTPRYLAPGNISATQTVSALAGVYGMISGGSIRSSIAPGADTYTAIIYTNQWSGSAYLGWNSVGSCTWTSTATGCNINNSGVVIAPLDQIDLRLATSGATFVANQTITAQVTGQ